MKYYECVICLELNLASRLHCQHCGTTPAVYSYSAKPINAGSVQVVRAFGSETASQRRAIKVNLRTVPADYYAE